MYDCERLCVCIGALESVTAGLCDDVHARAALHASIAACYRRNKLPAKAVAECDKALELLPRFGRALFRRATDLPFLCRNYSRP